MGWVLAEAWEPELLKEGLFDVAYGWDRHHTLNDIAKGKDKDAAKKWDENYAKDTARYEADDILMTFVTNHDENSWNGPPDFSNPNFSNTHACIRSTCARTQTEHARTDPLSYTHTQTQVPTHGHAPPPS